MKQERSKNSQGFIRIFLPLFIFILLLLGISYYVKYKPTNPIPPAYAQVLEDPVLVGAGDIGVCGAGAPDEKTALLLDNIVTQATQASGSATVFTAGDNAYSTGTDAEFLNCYHPDWGRHKNITRPAPGNHDYDTTGASGYFNYFGALAGDAGKGYFSYDLGNWHIVSLNSEVLSSTQDQWLSADLAANTKPCTLAYWHKPRFSSGRHGNNSQVGGLWNALYQFNADVIVNGHDHNYERFSPQDPGGILDTTRGIREFVVGTGGAPLRRANKNKANSEVKNSNTFGVLKLTLHSNSYDWQFVPIAGGIFTDSGTGNCH